MGARDKSVWCSGEVSLRAEVACVDGDLLSSTDTRSETYRAESSPSASGATKQADSTLEPIGGSTASRANASCAIGSLARGSLAPSAAALAGSEVLSDASPSVSTATAAAAAAAAASPTAVADSEIPSSESLLEWGQVHQGQAKGLGRRGGGTEACPSPGTPLQPLPIIPNPKWAGAAEAQLGRDSASRRWLRAGRWLRAIRS